MPYTLPEGALPQHVHLTASGLLRTGPGLLCTFIMTPASASNCSGVLYDGIGTGGRKIASVRGISGATFAFEMHHHILFREGLYLALSATPDGCTVAWFPIEDG